ncbi:MAG: NCS2 family permease [Phycisphaerae bacterium]|nr:NCS2 family permease [Phycisphaerae bacterium]
MNTAATTRYRWFVKGDLDGFFGLAVDNLVQVLVITALCKTLCGMSDDLIFTRILPGVAVSLLVGNLFYAAHAVRVARRDHNPNCTALPYGINTPTVFAFIFFIISPVYHEFRPTLGDARAAELAWKAGLLACLGSGLIEFAGSFIGSWIRRVTPRAALLSALAAIGIVFIASPFAFQIFERPLVAMLPMFIVLVVYFAHVRFPYGVPGGLVAVLAGSVLAWACPIWGDRPLMSAAAVAETTRRLGWHAPHFYGSDVLVILREQPDLLIRFLSVVFPMGVVNVLGSLQNIESAEAGGDRFATGPCMAVNGIGSIAAALFGSCFPTTIYIGHPGWKAIGARAGYSILNGAFFTAAFLLGAGGLITSTIPMEAGMAIVMWIGVVITAQSYDVTPNRHYSAVAIGMFPAVAAMAMFLLPNVLSAAGAANGILPLINTHLETLQQVRTDAWWPIGVYALIGANSGFVITTMMISAISAFLIDRRFRAAGVWCMIAGGLTLLGFQHAFRIEPGRFSLSPRELLIWQRCEEWFRGTPFFLDVPDGTFLHRGYRIAAMYVLAGALMLLIDRVRRRGQAFEDLAGPAV